MMGTRQAQKDLFSYNIDLDKRVRKDNPLRRISEWIDFTFVRKDVDEHYGHNGNVSEDPAVILKMMFLLFLDDVSSEREQAHSPAAYRDRRRRKHLAEDSFADAANNYHFKRSRWRRLWRQQIHDFLIGTIQNVKILMKHTERRLAASTGRILNQTEVLCDIFACHFDLIARFIGYFSGKFNHMVALNQMLRVRA